MTSAAPPKLPRLSRAAHTPTASPPLPERVLQFGKGNFLRGFVDWMVQSMNDQHLFGGAVVIVEATGESRGDDLNDQQGLFTTVLRGVQDGVVIDERLLIACVSRVLNPYRDDRWLDTAANPSLRFVVSNTTEAGIALDPLDALEARPSPSFPGKLTQWLFARYRHFDGDRSRGVVLLPCELIEDNGDTLQALVLDLAVRWGLPPGFSAWVQDSCFFTNTLVDRIVTGYPTDAASLCRQLGYEDNFLVVGEPYHAWVIEGPPTLEAELPLRAAGLNVVWTTDATPYRQCKVRLLNGTHTAMAVLGTLGGLTSVSDCIHHRPLHAFLTRLLIEEIQPTVALPAAEIDKFTRSVFERFANPFLQHQLSSILLNSASKFRTRLLDPLVERIEATGELPSRLTFVLAGLLVLYRPHPTGARAWRDEPQTLELFDQAWSIAGADPTRHDLAAVVARLLANQLLWGRDLSLVHPKLVHHVTDGVEGLLHRGVGDQLARLDSE